MMNTDHFEEVKPHANVPVDPGAVSTACVEVRFYSAESIVVLVDYSSMYSRLKTAEGVTDETGNLL